MIEFDNVKIFTDDIEQEALNQVRTIASTKIFPNPIRIMPDVHAGKGSVVGFTTQIANKVIPNIVGVDGACGMLTVNLGNIDIDYAKLDRVIRKYIPSGKNVNDTNKNLKDYKIHLEYLKCYKELKRLSWIECSLGTLGGGNHFIEIDVDEQGNKYLIIHTGSRNLGKQVAEIYQHKAIRNVNRHRDESKELIDRLKREGRQSEIEFELKRLKESTPKIPDELCYLEGQDMQDYLDDMQIVTQFANNNRLCIATTILKEMNLLKKNTINSYKWFTTMHNYISVDGVIRKGAIYAGDCTPVLIPLNMRDGCILGVGKNNKDWNYSAPHGAGRIMSRSQAKKSISLEDYKESMKNVWTTSVTRGTIDESHLLISLVKR